MDLSMVNNYIFDMDGTLINSEKGILKSHIEALQDVGCQYGLDLITREKIDWIIGPSLEEIVPRLINNEDNLEVVEYIKAFRHRYYEQYYTEYNLYEGIFDLLISLNNKGKRLFVCTSKPELITKKILKHSNLDTVFTGVKGAIDGQEHNKTDLLRLLLKTFPEVVPEESAMIGDRKYDIEAASECGFAKSIGVLYGFGTEDELRAYGANYIVNTARAILDFF